MLNIAIISGSIRQGRKSHYVAKYLNNYIEENRLGKPAVLDLKELNLPMLEEEEQLSDAPSESILHFKEVIDAADAVIIITPEYNGSYPAVLKNAIDRFAKSFYRKPVGIVGVSTGDFAGVLAIFQLQTLLFKIKAFSTTMMPISRVDDNIDENGNALQKEKIGNRTAKFFEELLWVAEAFAKR